MAGTDRITTAAQNLLDRSTSHDEIAKGEWSRDLHEQLAAWSDDWSDRGETYDYWGTDDTCTPPAEWRVELRVSEVAKVSACEQTIRVAYRDEDGETSGVEVRVWVKVAGSTVEGTVHMGRSLASSSSWEPHDGGNGPTAWVSDRLLAALESALPERQIKAALGEIEAAAEAAILRAERDSLLGAEAQS